MCHRAPTHSHADVKRASARVAHDELHDVVDLLVVGDGGGDVLEVAAHDAAVLGDNLELLSGHLGHVDGVHVGTGLDLVGWHGQLDAFVRRGS